MSTLGSLLQQLAALKAKVDEDQVAVLLSSIKHINEVLIVLIVGQDIGYDDMVAILIDWERKLIEKVGVSLELEKAFFSQNKSKNKGKPSKCSYCKKIGQTKTQCVKTAANEHFHVMYLILELGPKI